MELAQGKPKKLWFRVIASVFIAPAAIILIVLASLWWWAGTDGSIATVIRLVQNCCLASSQSLVVERAAGSLRAGGHVDQLVWQQGGLTVTAKGVNLAWQPWSLLQGRLKLERIAAVSVQIDDQRPPTAPSTRPPDTLHLPIPVALDAFSIGKLRWVGPTSAISPAATVEVLNLSGSYGFSGLQHELDLGNAQVASGRYSGRAVLSGSGPLSLQAKLAGTVAVAVPNSSAVLPLTFVASAQGLLTGLSVQAVLKTTPATGTMTSAKQARTINEPHASITATITPWATQTVPQAAATFSQLNLAALWPNAPQTLLTGMAHVQPIAFDTGIQPAADPAAWAIGFQFTNTLAGPWNQNLLPLDNVDIAGEWRSGAAIVRTLKAQSAGGEIVASGEWTQTAVPAWKLQASLKNINPAKLHTQLAAAALNGQATANSQGVVIGFAAKVQTTGDSKNSALTHSTKPPTATNSTRIPRDLLNQLRLQSANVTGSWNPQLSGGTLVLQDLRVRTDDAELAGQLEVQPSLQGGKAKLNLIAPGLDVFVQGELRPKRGDGDLNLRVKDMAQAQRWLQKLPGVSDAAKTALHTSSASGNADLSVRWQGGWQDPVLQARLAVPNLDWQTSRPTPTTSTTSTSTSTSLTATAVNNTLKIRDLQSTLSGRLSQAQLSTQGRAEMGARRYALQLQADAEHTVANGENTSLAAAKWQAVIKRLSLTAQDPALSTGVWGLAISKPVSVSWTPAASAFESSAGVALLSAPTAALAKASTSSITAVTTVPIAATGATIAWQPLRWRPGELTTAGKVTGLPLAWIELLAGPQLAGAGLSGNLVFDGEWDARLAQTLSLKASLARSSGDITLQTDIAQGAKLPMGARVAAGVRQARISLVSEGDALALALQWDTERAGSAQGQLKTTLKRAPANAAGAGAWTWPADAPLNGQLRAQLPRIGVWSVLAPPGWRIRGSLQANVDIKGTRTSPQLQGDLNANDLALRSVVDGIEFGNGRLRATLDGTRIRINEFTLQGAKQTISANYKTIASSVANVANAADTGGVLTAQGEATWADGPPRVLLDARLDKLRASIRSDRQVTLSGTLQARLDGKAMQLGGALKVDQARFLLPEEATPQLGDDVVVRSRSASTAGQESPSLANISQAKITPSLPQDTRSIKVAVEVDLGRDFRVQGKGIDTQLRGTLALSADALNHPRLVGTVNTFGGQYQAYGQRLDVEQGQLRFTGAVDNPALDILAIRPNLVQRVGVQINGTALLPRVRLYAQPELPDSEKLSWLVLGRSSASGGGEAALLQQAALALLGSKSGGMSGGLAASLGLDELSFRGASSNADGNTTEGAVTLGKRFSRNFYAAYERSISGALGTLFIFYDLSQRLTIRAQAGQQSGIDLIFTVPYD